MKQIILAFAFILTLSNGALADARNGVPSPYNSTLSRSQNPVVGNASGFLRQYLRLPQIGIVHGSPSTRKYGTPVGYCKPIKKSGGGVIGKIFGYGYVDICR